MNDLNMPTVSENASLEAIYPHVSKEWHSTKNAPLLPGDVTPASKMAVWWRCQCCHHEWHARISHRTFSDSGCPICSKAKRIDNFNKALLSKRKMLTEAFPKIANEWHPTENLPLTPSTVLASSGRKVWWQCSQGHVWRTAINNRTRGHTNCPQCNPQTSILEIRCYTEMEMLFGDANWRAKVEGLEIDVWIPKLQLGIEVDGYPWHKERETQDIAKTKQLANAGIKLIRIRDKRLKQLSENDICFTSNQPNIDVLTVVVEKLADLGYLNAKTAKDYSSARAFCNEPKFLEIIEWLPRPPLGRSLAECNPELVAEWSQEKNSPLTPAQVTPGSNLRAWWICAHGHEWQAFINNRARGVGCPKCSGKLASPNHNLAIAHPDILRYWDRAKNHGLPEELTPGSNKKAWWQCPKGHSFEMTVKEFAKRQGCPFCSGKRVDQSNSLATHHPTMVPYWDHQKNGDLTPHHVAKSSGKPYWWLCPRCGNSWQRSPNAMAKRSEKSYCPKHRLHE